MAFDFTGRGGAHPAKLPLGFREHRLQAAGVVVDGYFRQPPSGVVIAVRDQPPGWFTDARWSCCRHALAQQVSASSITTSSMNGGLSALVGGDSAPAVMLSGPMPEDWDFTWVNARSMSFQRGAEAIGFAC